MAMDRNKRAITFKNQEHEIFYMNYLSKCKYQDVYHKALIYCLGISGDTRQNVERIFDFDKGSVRTECLEEGWITSGSAKVVRMAFNLFCNGTPNAYAFEGDEKVKECQCYTVEELFCCEYAICFWEAVKVRYPEYCFPIDLAVFEMWSKIMIFGVDSVAYRRKAMESLRLFQIKDQGENTWREMTVYRARGTSVEVNNPLIMMQGKWLRETGFSTGNRIAVTCERGRLIIERTSGIWSDPKGGGNGSGRIRI